MTRKPLRRWPRLLLSFVLFLFIGLIYAWSVFVSPLERQFGWSRADTSVIFTISIIFYCLGAIFSGRITGKRGSRFTVTIASFLILAGLLGASRVTSLHMLFVLYGVVTGFGIGMTYNAVLAATVPWFPDCRGIVSGVLLMGFALGGMVFGSLATALMRHVSWSTVFAGLGVALFALLFVSARFLKIPGPEVVFPPDRTKKQEPDGADLTTGQMLRQPSFYAFSLYATFIGAAGLAMICHVSPAALELASRAGMSEGAASVLSATAVSLVSIGGGIGRVLSGICWDKFGRKRTMVGISLINIFGILLILLALRLGAPVLFCVAGMIVNLAFGGVGPVSPILCASFYGRKHYAMNMGLMNSTMMISALVGPTAMGAMKTATGDYFGPMCMLLGFCLVSLLAQSLIRRPAQPE